MRAIVLNTATFCLKGPFGEPMQKTIVSLCMPE